MSSATSAAAASSRPGCGPAARARSGRPRCGSRASRRSVRTRAAACTPRRSKAPCTGSPPGGERMPELADHAIARLRADNPGPYTLDGTNTWVVGRDPAWVVDPGPALEEHLDAVTAEVEGRGGAGGIALTHDHEDHVEGVPALRERLGDPPVAAARYPADTVLGDGATFGPLRAIAIPGHADDHLAFAAGGA